MKAARFLLFFFSFFSGFLAKEGFSQIYDPAPGNPGSLALEANSPRFRFWATQVMELERGWKNIAIRDSGKVDAGTEDFALGPALQNGVVSLGDGGWITLTFPSPIRNGEGPDFAVFENGFSDEFLELATVEVSSDGRHFVPFPSVSLTSADQQIPSFGSLDPRNLSNLAGKYRLGFGTGFDLEVLKNEAGLNLESILQVRVRDVVGCVLPEFARFDSRGNPINDPWPTPFPTGGFDLDAIGVIHSSGAGDLVVSPSSVLRGEVFRVTGLTSDQVLQVFDFTGRNIARYPVGNFPGGFPARFPSGFYFIGTGSGKKTSKLWVR